LSLACSVNAMLPSLIILYHVSSSNTNGAASERAQ
jgi:hypothetical protein